MTRFHVDELKAGVVREARRGDEVLDEEIELFVLRTRTPSANRRSSTA